MHHKYKWTLEEIIMISVLGAGAIAGGVVALINQSLGWALIAGGALFLSGYSYFIAKGRKKKSELTATYYPETTELIVSGHTFDGLENSVNLNELINMTARKMGSKEYAYTPRDIVILSTSSEDRTHSSMKIPLRMFSNDEFWAIMEPNIEKYGNDEIKIATTAGRNLKV